MTADDRFDKDGETQETVDFMNPDLQGNGYWRNEETDSYIIDTDEISVTGDGQSLEGRRATDGVEYFGRQYTDEVGRQSTDEDDGDGDGVGNGNGIGANTSISGTNSKSGMNGTGSIGKDGTVCVGKKRKAYTGINGTIRKVKSPKPNGMDTKAKPPESTGRAL